MLSLKQNISVYIAVGVTDMRKSINGLSLLVQDEFELNVFSGSLFAFCNRKQDIVKILYWEKNGFCIWMKRLEKEKFRWPESEEELLEVSQAALGWLLQGLDLSHAHHRLDYNSAG